VEGVVIGCWSWVGGVVVVPGLVEPVGRPNMASIVGRSAAPKGVERKSEGKSDHVNIRLTMGVYRRRAGNGAREKRAFDPWRDRSSCQKPDAIVRERVAVEVYQGLTS